MISVIHPLHFNIHLNTYLYFRKYKLKCYNNIYIYLSFNIIYHQLYFEPYNKNISYNHLICVHQFFFSIFIIRFIPVMFPLIMHIHIVVNIIMLIK